MRIGTRTPIQGERQAGTQRIRSRLSQRSAAVSFFAKRRRKAVVDRFTALLLLQASNRPAGSFHRLGGMYRNASKARVAHDHEAANPVRPLHGVGLREQHDVPKEPRVAQAALIPRSHGVLNVRVGCPLGADVSDVRLPEGLDHIRHMNTARLAHEAQLGKVAEVLPKRIPHLFLLPAKTLGPPHLQK
eukprot:scaffold1712_cov261-Pinguiococcus_pyrenoidosus.AAC.6